MEMDRPKKKTIQTDLDMKDYTNGAGVLCLSLYEGDFISLGASVFIGFSKLKNNCIRIGIVSQEEVQRYQFVVNPVKISNGEE